MFIAPAVSRPDVRVDEAGGDGAAVCFQGAEQGGDDLFDEGVEEDSHLVVAALGPAFEYEHGNDGAGEEGFPRVGPGVVVGNVGEMGWYAEAEFPRGGLCHAGFVDFGDERDEFVDGRRGCIVGHVVEFGYVEPCIRCVLEIAPTKGFGDVGWSVDAVVEVGYVGALHHVARRGSRGVLCAWMHY